MLATLADQLAVVVLFPVDPRLIEVVDQPVNVLVYPVTGLVGVANVIVGVVMLYVDGLDGWFVPPFIVYDML